MSEPLVTDDDRDTVSRLCGCGHARADHSTTASAFCLLCDCLPYWEAGEAATFQ